MKLEPSVIGPPWSRSEDMVSAYRQRLNAGLPPHALFYYMDETQYRRKLDCYASLLRQQHWQVGTLLDVGCGTGEFLRYYSPSSADYLGVDVVREFVEMAKARFPQFTFHELDILQGACERFDTVMLIGALGTSPRALNVLSRCADVARSNLLFDFLPSGGSAERVSWLQTFTVETINSTVGEAWAVRKMVSLGMSTVVIHCSRVSS